MLIFPAVCRSFDVKLELIFSAVTGFNGDIVGVCQQAFVKRCRRGVEGRGHSVLILNANLGYSRACDNFTVGIIAVILIR